LTVYPHLKMKQCSLEPDFIGLQVLCSFESQIPW